MANQSSDFPIPSDVEGFYLWDKLHCPRPLSPLEHEVLVMPTGIGFSKAIGDLGSALIAVCRSINYYNYLTGVPRPLAEGETAEERKARYEKNVAELLPKLGDLWENQWLPEMKPKLELARNVDYTGYSDAALIDRFDEMARDVIDRWTVHGYLLYSFFVAGEFADYYKEHVADAGTMEGYEALQGFETEATRSSNGLWALSRAVRKSPELLQIFESAKPEELLQRLGGSEAGKAFLGDLHGFLEDYGWRADSVYKLMQPSWWEDPGIPLAAVHGYVGIGDEAGPVAQFEAAVARREELLANARAKLSGEPAKLRRFEELYAAAKSFTPIVEDHNHWIDQMGDITLRYPALELGKRLAARGVIEKMEDVFMLYAAEIREAMAGKDFRTLASERAAEMAHYEKVVPPPALGVPPPPTDPVEEVLIRFFGTPVEPSADSSVLTGIAAAPGTATGVAKVVRSLDEASKLQQGDIMVCEMTLPPWTPLFSTVSAVVADTGGILSHCAIVAREYRIPCVVGTGVGTSTIKDGQRLTVDGSKGIVRIES